MKVSAAVFIGFILLTSFVKPRFVDIEEELSKATFVGEIVVRNYGKKYMYFSRLTTPKVVDSTACGGVIEYANYNGGYLTNTWPVVRDTVIAVMDSNSVSLFAQILKNDYRFWSPCFTGSIASFAFNAPFRKLDGEKENTWGDKKSTWDGVMLAKGELGRWRRD